VAIQSESIWRKECDGHHTIILFWVASYFYVENEDPSWQRRKKT